MPPASTPSSRAGRPALTSVARAQQQLQLVGELLNETARNYLARLQREIREMVELLAKRSAGARLSRAERDDLEKLLEQLGQLQIDPAKGRRKDLKKIDSLIGDAQAALEKWARRD